MIYRLVLLFGIVAFVAGCLPDKGTQEVYKIAGNTMGTTYNISRVDTEDRSFDIKNRVDHRLREINAAMSTYISNSELSQINRSDDINFRVSSDLAEVLSISLSIYRASQGLFDVTIGPLVNLWGFGPDAKVERQPSNEQILLQLDRVGSDALKLQALTLERSEYRYIDLSAVAKGWGVDQIAELYEDYGIDNYLVEIGGEMRLSGNKPSDIPWRIAIERPSGDLQQRSPQLIFSPGARAVATSGDYRNYFELDGVRYSHTIDVKTGKPISHRLASVSVIHERSAYADAWATALNVAGPEAGLLLAEQNNLAAYMIVREENGFKEYFSNQFRAWFPEVVSQSETQDR